MWTSRKHDRGRCSEYVPSSLYQWRHKQDRHAKLLNTSQASPFMYFTDNEQTNVAAPWGAQIWDIRLCFVWIIIEDQLNKCGHFHVLCIFRCLRFGFPLNTLNRSNCVLQENSFLFTIQTSTPVCQRTEAIPSPPCECEWVLVCVHVQECVRVCVHECWQLR